MDRRDPRSFLAAFLRDHGYAHEVAEQLVQNALDTHAHELAGQIRAESAEWDGWPEKQTVMRWTADLIDPEAQR